MCKYCEKDNNNKPIIDSLAFEPLSIIMFLEDICNLNRLHVTDKYREHHTVREINYCPMCGRKLGE